MKSAILVFVLFGSFLHRHKPAPPAAPPDGMIVHEKDGTTSSIEKYCTTLSDGTVMFSAPDMVDMFGSGKTCKDAARDYQKSQYIEHYVRREI
jgi:hypothetical protein